MNKKLNFINNFKFIYLLVVIVMFARPAYSIPTTIDEFKQSFSGFCSDLGISFCAVESDLKKKKSKPRKFTKTEKEILTKLAEQQEELSLRSLELDRREEKLKTLQEDIQQQVSQLEKLQHDIEKDINKKKTQDNAQVVKAVALYSKMNVEIAAKSLAKIDRKIAVNILKQMKEKQASLILSSMGPDESASMIEEITKKK